MNSHVLINYSLRILKQVKDGNDNMNDDIFKVLTSPTTLTVRKKFQLFCIYIKELKCNVSSPLLSSLVL